MLWCGWAHDFGRSVKAAAAATAVEKQPAACTAELELERTGHTSHTTLFEPSFTQKTRLKFLLASSLFKRPSLCLTGFKTKVACGCLILQSNKVNCVKTINITISPSTIIIQLPLGYFASPMRQNASPFMLTMYHPVRLSSSLRVHCTFPLHPPALSSIVP